MACRTLIGCDGYGIGLGGWPRDGFELNLDLKVNLRIFISVSLNRPNYRPILTFVGFRPRIENPTLAGNGMYSRGVYSVRFTVYRFTLGRLPLRL